jgi:hypothetical protein
VHTLYVLLFQLFIVKATEEKDYKEKKTRSCSVCVGWLRILLDTANEGPVRIQYKWLVPIYVFPEMKLLFPKQNYNVLSPYSYTHISVRDLYCIFPGSVCLFCYREICGPILGIYKSLTDTLMWKLGLKPRNSQKRNHKWDFPCSGGLSRVAVFPPFPLLSWGIIPPGQIFHHQMKCSCSRTLSLSFSPLWFKATRALLINCHLALA